MNHKAHKSQEARNGIISIRMLMCFLTVFAVMASVFAATYPQWWAARGVLNTNANVVPNDFAPATLGQLKWMAANARNELNANLPGCAGSAVNAMADGLKDTNNYAPATIGQAKALVAPIYDRLIAEGYTKSYPWSGSPNAPNDHAPIVLGQLKTLFNFDLTVDVNGNGIPDWLEMKWFGHLGFDLDADSDGDGMKDGWEVKHWLNPFANDAGEDPDHDGLTNAQELESGTDPQVADTVVDLNQHPEMIEFKTRTCTHTKVQPGTSGFLDPTRHYSVRKLEWTGSGHHEWGNGAHEELNVTEGVETYNYPDMTPIGHVTYRFDVTAADGCVQHHVITRSWTNKTCTVDENMTFSDSSCGTAQHQVYTYTAPSAGSAFYCLTENMPASPSILSNDYRTWTLTDFNCGFGFPGAGGTGGVYTHYDVKETLSSEYQPETMEQDAIDEMRNECDVDDPKPVGEDGTQTYPPTQGTTPEAKTIWDCQRGWVTVSESEYEIQVNDPQPGTTYKVTVAHTWRPEDTTKEDQILGATTYVHRYQGGGVARGSTGTGTPTTEPTIQRQDHEDVSPTTGIPSFSFNRDDETVTPDVKTDCSSGGTKMDSIFKANLGIAGTDEGNEESRGALVGVGPWRRADQVTMTLGAIQDSNGNLFNGRIHLSVSYTGTGRTKVYELNDDGEEVEVNFSSGEITRDNKDQEFFIEGLEKSSDLRDISYEEYAGMPSMGGPTDAVRITVVKIDVGVASVNTNIYKLASNLPDGMDHFVTVKGQSPIGLVITNITPDVIKAFGKDSFFWSQGAHPAGSVTSVSMPPDISLDASETPVNFNFGSQALWKGKVWVVWMDIIRLPEPYDPTGESLPHTPIGSDYFEFTKVDGTRTFIHGYINPIDIVSVLDDIPNLQHNLSSGNNDLPQGHSKIDNGIDYGTGAVHDWDITQAAREVTVASSAGGAPLTSLVQDWNDPVYGVGNDDCNAGAEVTNPYFNESKPTPDGKDKVNHDVGEMEFHDRPGLELKSGKSLLDSSEDLSAPHASVGDDFLVRLSLLSWGRVHLGSTWYRISDYTMWHFQAHMSVIDDTNHYHHGVLVWRAQMADCETGDGP